MERLLRVQRFGTLEVRIPGRQSPVRSGVDREARAVGIERSSGVIEIGAVFIRLAPVEHRGLELRSAGERARGEHAEGDVRAVLPMVPDRRKRVVRGGWPMRESGRAYRGLAYRGRVHRDREVARPG